MGDAARKPRRRRGQAGDATRDPRRAGVKLGNGETFMSTTLNYLGAVFLVITAVVLLAGLGWRGNLSSRGGRAGIWTRTAAAKP